MRGGGLLVRYAHAAYGARGVGVAEEGGALVDAPPGLDEPVRHDVRVLAQNRLEGGAGGLRDHGREGVGRVGGGAGQALEGAVVRLRVVARSEGVEEDAAERDSVRGGAEVLLVHIKALYALAVFSLE